MTHPTREQLAREYAKSVGDDCLNQRTSPGTPVGECTYIFCGCHVNDAFLAGAQYQDLISREAEGAEILALKRIAMECAGELSRYIREDHENGCVNTHGIKILADFDKYFGGGRKYDRNL